MTFTITHSGTADEGDDYTVGTLMIEAGERTGKMDPRLEVVDDTVSEGEETIELTVTAAGYEEASCTIRLEDDEPAISGLAPAAGPVGTSVVITGANFGAAQGTSTVDLQRDCGNADQLERDLDHGGGACRGGDGQRGGDGREGWRATGPASR